MNGGPGSIPIDDLAAPVLNDVQRMAIDWGESHPTELTVDAVCEAAIKRVGFDSFGSEDFLERLSAQLEEMNADDERTGIGRMVMYADCVRYAANRLLIHDLLQRHPEIRYIPIVRPVIVVGLPRSGTTNLVNLLAADTRFRSMPLWESYEPVPNPRERSEVGGVDPRWTRCNQSWEAMQAAAPLVAAMHPMEPDHVHEEIELQLADFSSYNYEWVARAPKWRDYYFAHDQTPHYEYMKTVLQILQWFRPRERWVLKSPQHLEQLGPLLATFPDATFVVTHRDPVAVVQSTITMNCYGARTTYRRTRPEWYRDYWTERIGTLLDASLRDRTLLPAERTVDVFFHEYMASEFDTLQRVYDCAGIELTQEARLEISAYQAAHPRTRGGQIVYNLRGDFNTTPQEVRARFGAYFDCFDNVRIEVA
jgi:Sulfotransferase family